jgi:hypothetical protein
MSGMGVPYAGVGEFARGWRQPDAIGVTDPRTPPARAGGRDAERSGIALGERLLGLLQAELVQRHDPGLRAKCRRDDAQQACEPVRRMRNFYQVSSHGCNTSSGEW